MPAPFHWTEEKRKEMIAAYNNGEGIISIAKRFHVRHESISALLQEQGIQVKTRSEWSRRNICNYAYFHQIDTEEKAYWLGFLTADGCVTKGKKPGDSPRLTINLGIQDYEHLVKFKQALQASQVVSKSERSCSFTIYSSELVADLATHGIKPQKTLHTVPAMVAPELERHYWRGVIDGDGYIAKKRVELTLVGDYAVVLGFQQFVLAHCLKVKARIFCDMNIYTFQITGVTVRKILEVLYEGATVYLDRRYERAKPILS